MNFLLNPYALKAAGFSSPADLFAAGEHGLWLSAADISTLFQASGGTTPVTTNNNPVGYWGDKSGNANHCIQATAGARPLYQSAAPGILFDGSNDVLKRAAALTDTSGAVSVLFTLHDSSTAFNNDKPSMVLVSAADEAAANKWFEIGVDRWGQIYIEYNNAGTKTTLTGSSFLDYSTRYALTVVKDTNGIYAQVNGVEQNPIIFDSPGPLGWFGDVAGADNIVIGGCVTSGGLVRAFKGEIHEVIVTSKGIMA